MIHAKKDFDKRIEEENMYHQYEEDQQANNNCMDSAPIITPIQREDQ